MKAHAKPLGCVGFSFDKMQMRCRFFHFFALSSNFVSFFEENERTH